MGTTVAGDGTAGASTTLLNTPWGMAVAADGTLFVVDSMNNRVMRFREGSLVGTMVAGTGGSGSGLNELSQPSSVAVDAQLNLYVLDMYNRRVMLWPNNSSTGTRVAGTGSSANTPTGFGDAYGLAVDLAGNVYISDNTNSRVIKWMVNATNATIVAGTGTAGGGLGELNNQNNIALDEANAYLYIADQFNHRVVRYTLGNPAGTLIAGGNGAGPGDNQFMHPSGICVSRKTGAIYVSEFSQHRVQRWNPGASSGVTIAGIVNVPGSDSLSLKNPSSVALSPNETFLYVVDRSNHRIQRFELI